MVLVAHGIVVDVLAAEQRIRGSELQAECQILTGTGIYLLVNGLAGQRQRVVDVVVATVSKDIVTIPVLEVIELPADRIIERKIVVGPFKPLSNAYREAADLHITVI